MNGTTYRLILWELVVLICLIIKSTYTSEGLDTLRDIGRTLDKPNGFFRHLPSIFDYVGGDLVKSIVRLL